MKTEMGDVKVKQECGVKEEMPSPSCSPSTITDNIDALAQGLDSKEEIIALNRSLQHVQDRARLLKIVGSFKKQLEGKGKGSSNSSGTKGTVELKHERGSGWVMIPGQSFQAPRGNFDVELHYDGRICLYGKSAQYELPPKAITFAAELPNLKTAGSRIIFSLKEPIQVGKNSIDTLLVTPKPLPKSKQLNVKVEKQVEGADGTSFTADPVTVWRTLLRNLEYPVLVRSSNEEMFRSSKSKLGFPCYCGVEDGTIYPLERGLVFVNKPLLFLKCQDIDSVSIERGTAGAARNFDMLVEMKDGTKHEFRMIEREECDRINEYVQRLRTIQQNQQAHGGNDAEAKNEDEEDEEDSDFSSSDSEAEVQKKDKRNDDEDEEEEDDDDDEEASSDDESESDRDSDIDCDDHGGLASDEEFVPNKPRLRSKRGRGTSSSPEPSSPSQTKKAKQQQEQEVEVADSDEDTE